LPGYKGKAVIVPCAKKGEPYKLTGCDPIMCLAPSAEEKMDYQVWELLLEKENMGMGGGEFKKMEKMGKWGQNFFHCFV